MTPPVLPVFPDVAHALCDLLADLGTCGTETPKALQSSLPYIRVTRTGGADDLVTDKANVSVDVFAANADDAKSVAEQARQRLTLGPFLAGLEYRTAHGRIDKARTAVAPQLLPPTDSDNLRLAVASYQIEMRR